MYRVSVKLFEQENFDNMKQTILLDVNFIFQYKKNNNNNKKK